MTKAPADSSRPSTDQAKNSPPHVPSKETVPADPNETTKSVDETETPVASNHVKESIPSPPPKKMETANAKAPDTPPQPSVHNAMWKPSPKLEALPKPEEKLSTALALGSGNPAKPEAHTSNTAAVKTESYKEQPSQPDTMKNTTQSPVATEQTMLSSIPSEGSATAGLAVSQPPKPGSSTTTADATKSEAGSPQAVIKNDLTQAKEAVPTEVNPKATKTMVHSPLQVTIEADQAIGITTPDEPSAFDDALQAGVGIPAQAMSPGLDLDAGSHFSSLDPTGVVDTSTNEDESTLLHLPEAGQASMERELKLPSSVVPQMSPHPNASLPAQGMGYDVKEGQNAPQSPSEKSLAIDLDDLDSDETDLDDSLNLAGSHKPKPTKTKGAHQMSYEEAEAREETSSLSSLSADFTMGNTTPREAIAPSAITTPPAPVATSDGTSEIYDSNDTADIPQSTYAPLVLQTRGSSLKQFPGAGRSSQTSSSSMSALTDLSGLSSKPPSVSSKATTPFDADSPREAPGHFTTSSAFQPRPLATRIQYNVRPKVSIPTDLTPQEYAMECIEAGENSRLNAYALHQEEYLMLRAHISHSQVSTYLNIRNGILRLWVRNPQMAVTREEAIGCAKDTRWFDVANVCFDWLVRRGYINYGCVEIRQSKAHVNQSVQPRKRKTVVVIGAGFSGLGCARQLEGLFMQYSKRFRDMGEEPPRVVVLEGRNRVGGRVYSRAFETLPATAPGVMRGRRFTAEMGGMIITGFERGNPLNILVRGQLGLPYHCLLADMSLHDSNGTNVDLQRDTLVEQLYNVCLERVSEYKFKTRPAKLIEGNRDLMDEGRDSTAEGHKTIALIEETAAAQPHAPPVSEQNIAPRVDLVPVSTNRMTGKVHAEPGTAASTKAAVQAKQIGWTLKAGVSDSKDIDLDPAVNDPNSTLGSVLDNALMQHKDLLDLNAQDFRLFNWHIANLEYSNATNLNKLSSRGWDVDVGNEWDGRHTMVVGGYQSVARGLATLPAPLEIRHKAAVKRIKYSPDGSSGPARITLEDGKSIEADYVVNTIPLGVLKHGNVEFQPPLPSWKTQAIERLGFGVLNKVILVYKEAFWDKDRDIFGMLQTPNNRSSLNQKDYASRRGRFFQWFSVTNTTGMPCLLALMAGDAAYDTEITPNDELIAEATEVLRTRYGARVTQPLEAIVTRWESDRFARGSYSNAGVHMQPEDYQLMARTIGNLYFAGEHTIVTHPATVHGAYLSGLRAASDVLDAMLGPIEIPIPLVLPRETSASLKRKAQEEHKDPTQARLEAYEMEITEHILSQLGAFPLKPAKVAGNPYILYNKANYEVGRRACEEGRRAGKGKPSPNEVRTMTSKMWREASAEVRRPFEKAAEEQKRGFALALKAWGEAATKWERDAMALREAYVRERPSVPGPEELAGGGADGWGGARRAKRAVESYREADSDVDMD